MNAVLMKRINEQQHQLNNSRYLNSVCEEIRLDCVKDIIGFQDGEFSWRPTLQAQVHVSYFYGLVLMQLPAELLVEKFSPQIIALIGMTLSAVCCILTPLCAEWHIAGLMVVQTMKAIGHVSKFERKLFEISFFTCMIT